MKKLLLFVDQFGQTPQFLIKRNNHFHSVFGGIITIILYVVGLVSLIFFSEEIVFKNSPSVNLSTQTEEHPSKLLFFDNFEFIIGLQNKNLQVERNEKIFYPRGFLFKTIVNESGSYNQRQEIDLAPCEEELPSSKNYKLFEKLDLEGYYCLSKKQKSNITMNEIFIREFWGNNGFQMLQVKFYDCKNTSTKQNCASQEEIDSFLKLTDLSFYTIDNFIKTRDYKNPFERGLIEKFYYVSKNFQVSITEYIRHLEVLSDDGLLFTTNKTISSFKIDNIIDYNLNERQSESFVSFSIQLNNVKEMYYRKYSKIQDLAAQVGGIFKTLLIICSWITQLYSEHSYFEHLINNFFQIDFDDKPKQTINHFLDLKTKDKSLEEIPSLNDTKSFQNKIQPNNYINSIIRKNTEKIEKFKGYIRLRFFDKLFLLLFYPRLSFGKKSQMNKLYFMGRKKLYNYLEIDNLLKYFHSQESLNSLLFTSEQKKICDDIFYPILSTTFVGNRFSGNNITQTMKSKIAKTDPWFSTKIMNKLMMSNEISGDPFSSKITKI